MKTITRNFIVYLIAMSILIFLIGTFEVVRNDYMFTIVEDNLINAGHTPPVLLNNYYDFKNSQLFNNSWLITFLNWIGIIALFYIFVDAFRSGYKSSPMLLKEIFLKYNLMLMLFVYVVLIVFNYLTDLFINDLIVLLFNDIYESIYIFRIFNEFFIWLFLFAIFLNWFANQIKHFEILNG